MNKNTTSQPKNISRRDFAKLALGAMARRWSPSKPASSDLVMPRRVWARAQFGSVITCGQVTDFPNGSVTPFNEGRFYLVRLQDGGFLALYRKCTHLGCAVPWDATKSMFVCPCHASEFDNTGSVKNPPAPRPLDLFAVHHRRTAKSKSIPARRFNAIKFEPSQVVYA